MMENDIPLDYAVHPVDLSLSSSGSVLSYTINSATNFGTVSVGRNDYYTYEHDSFAFGVAVAGMSNTSSLFNTSTLGGSNAEMQTDGLQSSGTSETHIPPPLEDCLVVGSYAKNTTLHVGTTNYQPEAIYNDMMQPSSSDVTNHPTNVENSESQYTGNSVLNIPQILPMMYDSVYQCEQCGKVFSTGWSMRRHQSVHNLPFKCQYKDCHKAYSRAHGLVVHINNMHTNRRPFKCPICGKRFANIYCRKSHVDNKVCTKFLMSRWNQLGN